MSWITYQSMSQLIVVYLPFSFPSSRARLNGRAAPVYVAATSWRADFHRESPAERVREAWTMAGEWGPYLARQGQSEPSAVNAQEDNGHGLSSLHVLVEIASRMPLEPLPAMSEQARRRESPVTLPPLHYLLSSLTHVPYRNLLLGSCLRGPSRSSTWL